MASRWSGASRRLVLATIVEFLPPRVPSVSADSGNCPGRFELSGSLNWALAFADPFDSVLAIFKPFEAGGFHEAGRAYSRRDLHQSRRWARCRPVIDPPLAA
jgi:hypothetical protein